MPFILRLVSFVLFLLVSQYGRTHSSIKETVPSDDFNQELIDSLEASYKKLSESKRINTIITDCRKLGYFHPDEIISLIDKTLTEVRKSHNTRAEIELLFQKIYIVSDAYSDLETSKELSYDLLNKLPVSVDEQIQLLDFIARTHLAKSELIEAQNIYQDALQRLKKVKMPYSRAHTNLYWGVAITYSESQNYQKSTEYYLKCLDQAVHQNQRFMISSCYQNLADDSRKMENWKDARRYLDSARISISRITNKSDRVISQMGLFNAFGDFYKSTKELDSAELYLKKAIQLGDQYNDYFTKSYAMHSLGSVYLEQNRLDEAENLLLQSDELFKKRTPSLLVTNSRYLYELYKKKGMYNEALKWHEHYTALSDSVQKVQHVKTIAQATAKYEGELKDKTIDLLKKEKIVEAQSKEKYRRQWQIIVILLLLTLSIGAFYINHTRHQKNKTKIIHQVLGEERERTRISMDLHDGVCSQISTISRLVKNSDRATEHNWRENVAERLDNLNLEVRDISHNLSLIKYDQKNPFQHIIEDYIEDLSASIPILFHVEFNPEDEHVFLESERELVLFRVIQEICNNAIKYSQTEKMDLIFEKNGLHLSVLIRDYGIGFDVNSSGNGIRNIHERIEFLNGKVQLDTNPRGTTFRIKLSLRKTELEEK